MSKQWHGGKGSKRRNSDESKYADNWDLIWGKKKSGAVAQLGERVPCTDEVAGSTPVSSTTDEEFVSGYDTMPDIEDLEKIVDRELKKLKEWENESKK